MLKYLLYFCYITIVVFILLEVLVRYHGYAKMYLYDAIYMPFHDNKEIPFVLKPNLKDVRAQSNTPINTDDLGLRSLVPGARLKPKQPDEYRIVFLGDSFTFGQGVGNHETFPQMVENGLAALQSQYKVQVFNFAVSAYNVKTMTDTFRYRAVGLKPDLAIMCVIYDDFDTNRTGVVDKYGYIVNQQSTSLVGSFVKLSMRNLHVSYLIRDILFKKSVPAKSPGVPGANSPETLPPAYQYVLEFRDIAQAHGIPYLIVTLPAKGAWDANIVQIMQQFKRDGIKYYDLFSLAQSISLKEFSVSAADIHPSPLVHKRVGELLSKYIWEHYLAKRSEG